MNRLIGHTHMPIVVITSDLLLDQLTRDAPMIAASFDKLCEEDLREISSLLAEGSTVVLGGMHGEGRSDNGLQIWSAEVLINVANSLSAAVYTLRAGYRLVPGMILRSAVEAIALCLHGLQQPNALSKIKAGTFESPRAIATAKKIIPPFGNLYGFLSNQFVHMGPLHHSIQPLIPYTTRDEDLVVNLRAIRAAVWTFYVAAEFAFVDFVQEKRYWRLDPPDKAVYAPSESVQEWQRRFLCGPEPAASSHRTG
jgi:hypothetical protein